MEQLSKLLQQTATSEGLALLNEIITSEELKEALEILSQEEIEKVFAIAMREAMLTKRAEIKSEEYNRKIRNPDPKPNVTTQDFYKWVYSKAENEINGFSLNEAEVKIYKLLAMYFNNDIRFEEAGYSLKKGIMLYGGVGCGKTTIMKLFRDNPSLKYGVVECMTIADIYKDKEEGGSMVTHKYSNAPTICFNDLGTEIETGTSSHFGNKKNVMAEIILNHYERNESKNFKLHFTTNCNAEKLTQDYGIRVSDRLKEMCNIISLDGIKSKRK
jgi:DNA replication protein DnaC